MNNYYTGLPVLQTIQKPEPSLVVCYSDQVKQWGIVIFDLVGIEVCLMLETVLGVTGDSEQNLPNFCVLGNHFLD